MYEEPKRPPKRERVRYALLREDKGNMYIIELIAVSKEEISRLIPKIEERTAKTIIYEKVVDQVSAKHCTGKGLERLKRVYEKANPKVILVSC